jgi:phosphoribosyl 1,2-cyclic phosphate phosphodiesterase
MKSSFLFLGTGASAGVPIIGCYCPICTSTSPHNHRLRSSGLIKLGDKRFLIDSGPDFREQALRYQIERLDGLLLTHTHYDHIAGIDELRLYNFRLKQPMRCLLSQESLQDLQRRYYYFFEENRDGHSASAQFNFQVIEKDFSSHEFEGARFSTLSYFQGGMKVLGLRFGDLAYITDIREYDAEAVIGALKGVKKLVISALRLEPSPVQFNVEEAIEFARKVGAEETWLTHISHNLEHEQTERSLPAGVRMGYDGLEIEFTP